MLLALLIIPIIAAALVLLPLERRGRWAAAVTLLTNTVLLALAILIANRVLLTGSAAGLAGSLSIDGFGALLLLLVTFLGFTTAIFSWGYMVERRTGTT
ncbi:MAG: hypothetical protein WBR29_11500, partial [Gammaproteobacteria bacterium]